MIIKLIMMNMMRRIMTGIMNMTTVLIVLKFIKTQGQWYSY